MNLMLLPLGIAAMSGVITGVGGHWLKLDTGESAMFAVILTIMTELLISLLGNY